MLRKSNNLSKRTYKSVLLLSLPEYILLGLVLMSIGIFILIPIISVLCTSFFDSNKFTLSFYSNLISYKNFKIIGNSFFVASVSSLLSTLIAFCITSNYFISSSKIKNLIKNSLLITMISPPFVSALALIMLFGRRGLITYGIFKLSINPYGWQGIVLLQTISNISLATMMMINSFDSLDKRQLMASADLGATPMNTYKNIIIPGVFPGIISAMLISFTVNLADFGTPIIIGGNFKVLATEAYTLITSTGDLHSGAALSMLLLPPSIVAFYFYNKAYKKVSNMSTGSKVASSINFELKIPMLIKIIIKAITAIFFIIMFLKYANIFLATISNTSSGKIKFTLQYLKLLRTDLIESFVRSIIYAISAGIIASFIGVILSYYSYRRNLRIKIFEFIASMPYIIPGTFFGLGYIIAFNDKPFKLTGTAAIIIFNLAFRQLCVANRSVGAIFPSIDNRVEDAARDLGASRIKIIIQIIIPMVSPALVTSFVQTFTASMTAVGAIIFLISPGKNVASVEMFKAIQGGGYGLGAILAVMLIIVTVSVNVIAMNIIKRGEKI